MRKKKRSHETEFATWVKQPLTSGLVWVIGIKLICLGYCTFLVKRLDRKVKPKKKRVELSLSRSYS